MLSFLKHIVLFCCVASFLLLWQLIATLNTTFNTFIIYQRDPSLFSLVCPMSITHYSLSHFSDRLLPSCGDHPAESTVSFIRLTIFPITFSPALISFHSKCLGWKRSVLSLSTLPIYTSLSSALMTDPSHLHSVWSCCIYSYFSMPWQQSSLSPGKHEGRTLKTSFTG